MLKTSAFLGFSIEDMIRMLNAGWPWRRCWTSSNGVLSLRPQNCPLSLDHVPVHSVVCFCAHLSSFPGPTVISCLSSIGPLPRKWKAAASVLGDSRRIAAAGRLRLLRVLRQLRNLGR